MILNTYTHTEESIRDRIFYILPVCIKKSWKTKITGILSQLRDLGPEIDYPNIEDYHVRETKVQVHCLRSEE